MTTAALRQLTSEELRDEQIIQDMVKGCDINQVAHAYDVTLEHIQGLFQPPRFTPNNASVKALELARLDIATKALMPHVQAGDLEAIDSLLKVQNRRSKYLGLDEAGKGPQAPTTIHVEFTWIGQDRLGYKGGTPGLPPAEVVEALPAPSPVEVPVRSPWKEPEDKPDPEAAKLLREVKRLGPGHD